MFYFRRFEKFFVFSLWMYLFAGSRESIRVKSRLKTITVSVPLPCTSRTRYIGNFMEQNLIIGSVELMNY